MSLRRKKILRVFAVVLAVLLLTAGTVDYFCVDLFGGVFVPVTATFHYRQVLAWIRGNGYPTNCDVLAFFPKSIPDHASNTRMFFRQLPGDFDFELRCTLPPDEISHLVDQAGPVALVSGRAGDEMSDKMAERNEWMDPDYFDLADGPGQQNKLPPSFTIYLTHVGYGKIGANAEYVYETGLAVDPAANEVIYWLKAHASTAGEPHSPDGVTRH